MGVQMNVSFYENNGMNFVCVEDGKAFFNETVEKVSPNGKYCVAAGYWYINDEDSENDGDEIEGSSETIVFENEQILYKAPSVEDAEDYAIRDDGKLCILEEDGVSVWAASAKPVRKKFAFSWLDAGITTDFAWAYGDGDDGNLRLSVFVFETGKMWTKRLSQSISEIKAVLMVKDIQNSIYAVAENYDNEDIVIQYDMDGKKQDPTPEDLRSVLMAFAKSKAESSPPDDVLDIDPPPAPNKAKRKMPLWAIILIIAFVLLALIGKYVA